MLAINRAFETILNKIGLGPDMTTVQVGDDKIEAEIERLKAEHKVVLFTKSYCGYCHMAVDCLDKTGLRRDQYKNIDLQKDVKNGSDYQRVLKQMTGSHTVPRVFIDSKFVGGGTEMQAEFDSKRLHERLRDAGFDNIKSSL